MKAAPTQGSQVPSSAHGTARTAAASNRHIYLYDTPARSPGSSGTSEVATVASSFQVATYRTVQDAVPITRIAIEAYAPTESRLACQPPPRLSIGSSGLAVLQPLDPLSIALVSRITVGSSLNCPSLYSSVSHHLSVLRPTYVPDLGMA